jgi:putative endonuclease
MTPKPAPQQSTPRTQATPGTARTTASPSTLTPAAPTPPTPHAARAQVGAAAEVQAAEFLQGQGLVVIARNLTCKAGELDLVCLDAEMLVIVEVRLRGRMDYGGALASVTWRKQRKLVRATQFFWQRQAQWRTRRLRFDVVALEPRTDGMREIIWIKDAFRSTRA